MAMVLMVVVDHDGDDDGDDNVAGDKCYTLPTAVIWLCYTRRKARNALIFYNPTLWH